MRAWHFVGKRLRDGSRVPRDGVWLEHKGALQLCVSGLPFSRDPFDALRYATGQYLCLGEVGGEIIECGDKGVCSRRKIVQRIDATELLRYFARMQAISVVHMWDAPDVVLDYLMTGDCRLRAAAWAAAWDAAWDAAWAAAWAAAWDAAWNAAWNAAWDAARAAAWNAAWAAARAAAWDAARDAAWDAARQEFNSLVYETFGVQK